MMSSQESLNLDNYLRILYTRWASNKPREKALSYVQLVPFTMRQIFRTYPEVEDYFADKGLSMDYLRSIDKSFSTLESVSSYISTKGVVSDIEKTQALADKVVKESGFNPHPPKEVSQSFHAAPVNALSTTGQESLQGNIPDPSKVHLYAFQRKVINEVLKTGDSTKLSPALYLTPLHSSKIQNYKGEPGVLYVITNQTGLPYLFDKEGNLSKETKRTVSDLKIGDEVELTFSGNKKDSTFKTRITELNGDGDTFNINFDATGIRKSGYVITNDGEIDAGPDILAYMNLTQTEGTIMYYPAREVTKEGNTYSSKSDLAPVSAIKAARITQGIPTTLAEAEAIRQAQLKQQYDINQAVKEGKELRAIITGGSLGYTTYAQSVRTPLSAVNDLVNVEIQQQEDGPFFAGAAYFKVPGIQDPVLLQRNEIPGELISKLVSTFTDPLYESFAGSTHAIEPPARLALIKQYLNNTPTLMTTLDKGSLILHLNGESVDLTDPSAKDIITNYLSNYAPTPGFDSSNLSQEKKSGAIDGDKSGFEGSLYQGAIVKKTDNSGKVFYQKYTKPAFNINHDFIKNPPHFNDYTLEQHKDGWIVKSNPTDYIEYLKKNTYINYELNKKGKILALNSYFTFRLTEDALKTLYPVQEKVTVTPAVNPGITDHGFDTVSKPDKAIQSFIDRVKKEGLKKEIPTTKALEDQIAAAKQWYENSPLSKHFPFQGMFDVVNSDHIAQWTMDGIELYKGSDYSDLYHEAWHGFSQGFLSKDQKQSLYNEVKKISGKGKYSYKKVEELLAEDFRKYMLSGGKLVLDKRPVRNTIFRKIYAFLKSLFGNTTYAQALIDQNALNTIKDLYEKLRIGNLNEFTFSAENSFFDTLNKGVKATDSRDTVQELSPSESMLAVNTIDSLFSTFVDEYNSRVSPNSKVTNHIFTTESGRTAAYDSVLIGLQERRKELFWQNTTEDNPQIKGSNEKNIQTLDWMINNFGDTSDPKALKSDKGLIAYHNRKSKFLSYEDKFLDLEEKNLPEYGFKDGNETSVFEKGRPEVWYLIRGLHKLDKTEKPVLNKLGFPELVDFSSTKNRLIKTLQDSYDTKEMRDRLLSVQKKYPFVNQLLDKLGDVESVEKYNFGMWNSFFQTFNRYRIPQMTVLFDKQGSKYIAKVGEAYGDHRQVQRQWDQFFYAGRSGDPKLVIKEPNSKPYLNINEALKKYPKVNRANFLQFLNDIGVPIEADNEDIQKEIVEDTAWGNNSKTTTEQVGIYLRKRLQLLKENNISVKSLTDLFKEMINGKNESTRFDQIAQLQVKYSDQYSNFSVSTPTGDTRYEHSLNSSMTSVAKGINRSGTYQDMLNGSLGYLDRSRNPMAVVSKQLDALFKPDGTRTDVKYLVDNLNGTTLTDDGESTDTGVSSSGADIYTKFVQDLHLAFFKGVFENPRHGEKSTSVSTRVSKYNTPYSKDKRLWMGPENFLPNDQGLYKKIYDSILPYLFAEHRRVLRMNNLKPGDPELNYPDYAKNGKSFVLFDSILSKETKEELYKLKSPLEQSITPKLEQMMARDFKNYWDSQFDASIEQFGKGFFLADNLISNVTSGKDNPLLQYKTNKRVLGDILVKAFTFNQWIHNVESSILNYGDVAQYKTPVDFHKRIAMFSSTGDIFDSSDTMMRYLNLQGMGYARANNLPEKTFSNVLGSVIMKDPLLTSAYYAQIEKYLKKGLKQDWDQSGRKYTQAELDTEASRQAEAYKDMKIGDAQGWITFDSYRALSISIDKWSERQEDLYQRIVNGENIPSDIALEYFPVRKYQYAGPINTKEGLPVMAGHKFSLMPLVPSVIKNSPVLTDLHHKMISQKIDYATLHSGSKITTVTNQGQMDKMYSDWNKREFDNTPFTPNYIYLDFLKDQQDINSEYKGTAIFSTQLRKVIEEGLIEGGVPTDFETGKSLDTRRSLWNKLSESQKRKSPKYVLYKDYEDSVARLTEKKKVALIKEIGWDKPGTYGKVNDKLIELIQQELTRQDISDHELDYIRLKELGSEVLKYGDLSIHLSAEKIEKLLASLVNRRLVRQKISGEPLVQVSSLGWEDPSKFTNATPEDLEKYGSNDLPFYQLGKGSERTAEKGLDRWRTTSAMKVKVAMITGKVVNGVYKPGNFEHLLKLKDNEGNTIGTRERLNELLKDETWLNRGDNRRMITMIGTRIPVQGLNSMEFMEVYEFLPAEAGNIIIPPAEIVAKSGSDFDIDKLTVMIPNIREDESTKEVSLFRNYSEKEARVLYEAHKKEKIHKNEITAIKDRIRDETKEAGGTELSEQMLEHLAIRELEQRSKISKEEADLLGMFNTLMENAYQREGEIFNPDNIKNFDDFFKDINSNTKQEENEVMWNMRFILEHPDNYASLVRPNATFTLGPIADDKFRSQVSDYDPKQGTDKISGSRLMEYQYNLYVHQINKVAKEALAIAAVDNTFNIMFNRVGAYMNEFYTDKNSNMSAREAIRKEIKLYLPHNTLKNPEGKDVISLSHIMDAGGKHRISDNVSQVINLLLEIAKNDSAYYLQLNKEVIPTLLFLNQAGVPVDTLEYLVSQSIIREYMDEVRQAKSPISGPLGKSPEKWQFFQLQARAEMIRKYFPEMEFPFTIENKETGESTTIYNTRTKKAIPEIYKRTNQLTQDNPDAFSKERLKENLSNKEFSDKDKAVLLHWFEIEDMAKAIRDVKMRLNFDTKKTGSAFMAMNKNILINLLEQDQRIPNSITEGILNESPIASLKAQDFMIDFLKPLFPTRANTTIGNFLLMKVQSPQAMEEIENTFGDIDKFSVKFFNDLISYIFQNKLRDFNPREHQYRNMNTQQALDVQSIPYLKFGAFVKEDVLYYDLPQMIKDFTQKNYTNDSYKNRGLSALKANTFKTAKEFYNYVFEREYIRSFTKLSDIESDPKFQALMDKNKGDEKSSYEDYIRDRALENIGNGWKLFESDDSYANQVIRAIQEHNLTDHYPLLNTLTLSEAKGMQNLQLLDTDLTSDKIDSYHQVLSELADPSVYKVTDEKTNQKISSLFQKFPMVAFLQSGLNTSGSFSLIRLVPANNFMSFMQGAVSQFTQNMSLPKLERFYQSFIRLNRGSLKNRYKDYTAQDPGHGIKPVSKNILEIYEHTPGVFTYQPGKLTEKDAVSAVDQNPGLIFVYDKSIDKPGGVSPGSNGYFASSKITSNRTLGLPTLTSYSELKGKSLTDTTLEKNKTLIDQAIQDLKDLKDSGLDIAFSANGYGQGLIGYKQDGVTALSKDKPGLKTFLYLSQQLFNEFGYVNKNYDIMPEVEGIESPKEVLSKTIVSDQDVRDLMSKCLE